MKTIATTVVVMLLAATDLHAVCINTEHRVVEVQITECHTVQAFAETVPACPQFEWISSLQPRMLENSKGMIVRGVITAARPLTFSSVGKPTVGARSVVNEPGTWYYRPPAGQTCDKLPTTMELALMQRCCDVIPPGEASCWFGIDTLAPMPAK